ncbi:DNA internalization-related competence protein ComEC/Rec2 [Pseudobutyrivibrio xylanivorans]|nr:DNA internalization-related competence protein ComEC/Rec2 [Pseudobutyrivibrio xylanivorans]
MILIITFSVFGPWDFLGVYNKADSAITFLSDGDVVSAEGYVYHKEIKNDNLLYYVKDASVTTGSGTLSKTSFIIKLESDEIPNYCKLNIRKGIVKHFSHARNEGGFDMGDYYNSLGLCFELEDVSIAGFETSALGQYDFCFKLRNAISHIYETYLPGEEADFLSSVALGAKGGLDEELKTLFQEVGIAHILAVSGLHVSVVCMALYSLLRRRGLSFVCSGALAGNVAVFYGFLTGGSVSSVRAIGMFLIYLGAQVAGESYDMLTALAVMADFLLIDNFLIIKNASFIFSFGAVLGIIYVAMPFSNVYVNYSRLRRRSIKSDEGFVSGPVPLTMRLVEYIVSSLVFSFGMNVAMLPIVTQLFYQTPIYSVLLNLVVLPMMPALLLVGLIAGIIGLFISGLAGILFMPCHFIIYFYELISYSFSKLPMATIIVGKKSLIAVIIYYVVLVAIIRIYEVTSEYLLGKKSIVDNTSILLSYKKKLWILSISFVLISLIWFIPSKSGFEMDFIDVGQGDGIFINSGDDTTFFIDGGSTNQDTVGKYTMLPFLKSKGVRKIDYWFLSHTDEDHVSGFIELLESGYKVEKLVLSEVIPKDEMFNQIEALAKANGTEILYMRQGDIVATKHVIFRCVYPFDDVATLYADDVNALSLSLVMSYDSNSDCTPEYTAFFGGDIAAEQEQLIAKSGLVGHVNLLKVSHHGSRFSSDSIFLNTLSPDTAIISCSKKNRYGHPADEAISRLEEAGCKIYYTMNSGRICVSRDGIDLYVE